MSKAYYFIGGPAHGEQRAIQDDPLVYKVFTAQGLTQKFSISESTLGLPTVVNYRRQELISAHREPARRVTLYVLEEIAGDPNQIMMGFADILLGQYFDEFGEDVPSDPVTDQVP
jgi:hypothetical protein